MDGAVISMEESKAAHGDDALVVANLPTAGGGSGQAPSNFSKITFSEQLPAEGSIISFPFCLEVVVSAASWVSLIVSSDLPSSALNFTAPSVNFELAFVTVSLARAAVLSTLEILSREVLVSVPLSDSDLSALFLLPFLPFDMPPCWNVASLESELEEDEDEEDEGEEEDDEEEDIDERFRVDGLILGCADTGIGNASWETFEGDLRVSKLGTFELDSPCSGPFGSG